MPIQKAILNMVLLAALAAPFSALAVPPTLAELPPALRPWVDWVLHDAPEHGCPSPYNNGDAHLCNWPAQLALTVDQKGAAFTLNASLNAPGWLALPGDAEHWPQQVKSNDTAAAVLADADGNPQLYLPAGRVRVSGQIVWAEMPQTLATPAETGLLSLSVNGQATTASRDNSGALWLGRQAEVSEGRPLKLSVYRRLEDEIPPRLSTHLLIEAAGTAREVVLGPLLPAGFEALTLNSDLPARLDESQRLHLQTKPGVWHLELVARGPAALKSLSPPKIEAPWPEQEVWSWAAAPQLRLVEVSGAPAIDPRQTQMPEDWRALPAYQLDASTKLTLTEKQRGGSAPAPDELSLQRRLWLDADGGGYTAQDQISGVLRSQWRLDAEGGLAPGQVLINGEPQLITRGPDGKSGVELRSSPLQMTADSRLPAGSSLPVGGWSTAFNAVDTQLNLGPGWLLIAAPGADAAAQSWALQWTLLDVFMVLIAAVASARLLGPAGGALALATLLLSWQEPGALRWSWLHLLAVTAVLSALPASYRASGLGLWLRRWRLVAVLAVASLLLPFAISEIRGAIYPVLEPLGSAAWAPFQQREEAGDAHFDEAVVAAAPAAPPPPAAKPALADAMEVDAAVSSMVASSPRVRSQSADKSTAQYSLARLAPNVLTQTGPGLPDWSWRSASLHWSGPVTSAQHVRLWLSPPWLTRSLRVLMIAAALAWLAWLLKSGGAANATATKPEPKLGATPAATSSAALMVLIGVLAFAPAKPAQAQQAEPAPVAAVPPGGPEAPSAALLAELRSRLLEAPVCLPACADISRMGVVVSENNVLELRLTIAAQRATAVPLPVPRLAAADQPAAWQPQEVLAANAPATVRRDEEGTLWFAANAGVQEVLIRGPLGGLSQLELPLPLAPRLVASALQNWTLAGVNADGKPAGTLQLTRTQASSGSEAANQGTALPPILRIQRRLSFGLDWEVETTVSRDGASQLPVLAEVALLPDERPLSEGLVVNQQKVQVTLAAEQAAFSWRSRLPVVPHLILVAATAPLQFESWQFEIAPLWRADFDGIPPVSHTDQNGNWLPQYRPWPGEALKLSVSKPEGVKGQTLTLDHADLALTPGTRLTEASLRFTLRASQGGPWSFMLPEGYTLTALSLDDQPAPQRLSGRAVSLNLHPGSNRVAASLKAVQALPLLLRTPVVSVGMPGVNARISVQVPDDRWLILLGGPRFGPALLFWGVLLVWLVVAVGLGRLLPTPLKAQHWLLLALGLSQLALPLAAIVIAWLLALAWRGRVDLSRWGRRRHNLLQLALGALTLVALSLLFSAVAKGLLGQPDMMIAGNSSHAGLLLWAQDRYTGELPTAWVFWLSIWVYRALMLAWALWLALKLISWLRWGWQQWSEGGLWRAAPPKPAYAAPASEPPP